MRLLLVGLLASSLAHADGDPRAQVPDQLARAAGRSTQIVTPSFAFDTFGFHLDEKILENVRPGVGDLAKAVAPLVGFTPDGNEAWIASDVASSYKCDDKYDDCTGGFEQAGAKFQKWRPPFHASALFVKRTKGWEPAMWHFSTSYEDKDVADFVAKGKDLAAKFPRQIAPGAEDVAKQFESTIGDLKAFAKSLSDRKEVAVLGSAAKQRFVGKAAKQKLASWKLSLAIRDGLVAGLSDSKQLAWVATQVDARPLGKKDAKPTPYRLSVIYEKTAKGWKAVVVQLSFSKHR